MCISKAPVNTMPSLGINLDALSGAPATKPVHRPKRPSKSGRRRDQFIVVQHHYHDHALEPASQEEQLILDSAQQNPLVASFPMKLFMMLEQVEADGNAHIVSWQEHGRCFVVHEPELFKELLPRYFSLSKVSSFQRQLNLYDFTRLTRGRDKGGYYNEYFLRARPHLLSKIQRIKVKGTGVRARSNPEQEPNFWNMPFVGPAPEAVASATTTTSSQHHHHGSASIVSTEDVEDNNDQMNMDMGPLHTMSNVVSDDNMTPVEEVSTTSDIKLCGWGMPFYYLDSLPTDTRPTTVQSSYSTAAKPAPVSCSSSDYFLSSLDMDGFVDNVLEIDDTDASFNALLQQIVD